MGRMMRYNSPQFQVAALFLAFGSTTIQAESPEWKEILRLRFSLDTRFSFTDHIQTFTHHAPDPWPDHIKNEHVLIHLCSTWILFFERDLYWPRAHSSFQVMYCADLILFLFEQPTDFRA